jgi:hypothetical protein
MPTPRHTAYQPTQFLPPVIPLSCADMGQQDEQLSLALLLPSPSDNPSPSLSKVCPEIGLMQAVLEDAINCFQRRSSKKAQNAQRLAREAEEWLLSNDLDWPFSFLNICSALGLDPDYIRRGLKRWRQSLPTERQKRRRLAVPVHRPMRIAA